MPVPDVPWLQANRGKANIVGFFESMSLLKITRFEPHTIFDGGDEGLCAHQVRGYEPGQQLFVPQQWPPLADQRGWHGRQVQPRYRHRSDDQDGQRRMTIAGTGSRNELLW